MTATLTVAATPVNDVVLHVREWGHRGVPLLLLHGYTGSGLDWVDVAPELAADRRVIAYDHRGHGDSTNLGTPAAYTFEKLAADLASFVEVHEAAQVDLLGHSMGGVVAMMYVLAHPERVRSLVLMDTAAAPARNVPMDTLNPLVALGREQGMAAVAALAADFGASMARPGGLPAEVLRERAVAKMGSLDVEALSEFALELGRYPSMIDGLVKINRPVTVIVGENDDGLRAGCAELAERIPGATLEVIPGAGHSPQEDRPLEWLAAVRGHLARVEARA